VAKGTTGLALSGGAARGIAHIGVLKVLDENDVHIECVAGTSVGSIIGALYCSGMGPDEMLAVTKEISWQELVKPTLSGMGLVETKRLEAYMVKLIGDLDFADLKIPFRAVAVDIGTATQVVIDSGSVARAVRASSSVPGIFEPVMEEGVALVDGGVINNLPVDEVREMGARRVIAVDLNADRSPGGVPQNLIDVTYRTFMVLLNNSSSAGREDADILIQPDLSEIPYYDLGKIDRMFELGVAAAERHLSKLKKLPTR
jgi:NTE family protein